VNHQVEAPSGAPTPYATLRLRPIVPPRRTA